jgi:hypothetical protein
MARAAKQERKIDYHSKRTRDHRVIRTWAEARSGRPAMVRETQILRIDFDDPDEKLHPVSWEEFFRVFDGRELEFLFQEHTHDGKISRFNKLVNTGSDEEEK